MKLTLFIDFDGTLCHDKYWRSLPSDIFEKLQTFLFKENKDIVTNWMRGEYSSEDINELISEELQIDKNSLWELFVSDCKNMHVSQTDLEKMKSLQKQFHTVLITDNMDCFDRFINPALKLDSYFDTVVNSYNEKKLKSEDSGSLFLKYVVGDIKNSVLIDNSKKVCEIFSSLGGIVFHVKSDEKIDLHLRTF